MKENIVTFQVAKLAKEKGFDEYCLFVWNEENLEEPYYYAENYEMICRRIHYYGDIPLINNSYIEKYAAYVEKDEVTEEVYELIAAPTQTSLQKWLRDKHRISVCVDFRHSKTYKIEGINSVDYDVNIYTLSGGDAFKTIKLSQIRDNYEEALEIGLFNALQLIQ